MTQNQILKRKILVIILLVSSLINLFATEQYADRMIINETIYEINKLPFEDYFKRNPSKRPNGLSTALYRGYVATFEFIEDRLVLKDIEVEFRSDDKEKSSRLKWKSIKNELFNEQDTIEVNWFSGLIMMTPQKNLTKKQENESYRIVELENGEVKYRRIVFEEEEKEFRLKQFKAFKKQDLYKRLRKEMRREIGMDKKVIREILLHDVFDLIEKIEKKEDSTQQWLKYPYPAKTGHVV